MRIIAPPNEGSNALEVVRPNGDLIWAVSPTGGAGVLLDYTLPANAASVTVGLPDLTGIALLRVLSFWRVANGGDPGGKFDRVRMRINGDTTAGNYQFGVANADLTDSLGTAGAETSILMSHATTNECDANTWGHSVLEIPFPGDSVRIKQMTMRWSFYGNFDGTGVNPIGTHGGGFWKSTAPITSLTFFPFVDTAFLAGSRVVILAG